MTVSKFRGRVKKWPSMSFYWRGYFEERLRKFEYWMLVGWDLSPCHLHCGGRTTGKSQAVPTLPNTKYFRIHCTVYLHKYTSTKLHYIMTQTRTSHLNFTVELLNQWHEQYILREHNICSTARRIRATVASVRKSDKGWRWTPSPVSCHRAWLFTPCHHHHHHCDHGHQYHAASPC